MPGTSTIVHTKLPSGCGVAWSMSKTILLVEGSVPSWMCSPVSGEVRLEKLRVRIASFSSALSWSVAKPEPPESAAPCGVRLAAKSVLTPGTTVGAV